ncbi:MAG: hypothetical protein ACFWTJ_10045 [Lachnoclostridium sp.]
MINYKYGNEISYDIIKLGKNNYTLLKDFDCGSETLNNYFREECENDDSVVTYLFVDKKLNKLIGCVSLACSGIMYEVGKYVNTFPAIEIKYFAVRSCYQDLLYEASEDSEHYYFSDELLSSIIFKCCDISQNIIGASYLILYSVKDAVHFYRRNKFIEYNEYMKKNKNQEITDCYPMFLPL